MTRPFDLPRATVQPACLAAPQRYVFLLLSEFSQVSFSCAVEALRVANGHDGKRHFSWEILSSDGEPVAASNGLKSVVDGPMTDLHRQDTLVVCGGDNVAQHSTNKILSWVRTQARRGVRVGGVSSAAITLAMAGLLNGRTATVHWDFHNAMLESFPGIDLQDVVFAVDDQRFTCAGGAASIDLMLCLIEQDHGRNLANHVAEKLVYNAPRNPHHSQRLSMQLRSGARNTKLCEAIDIMNDNLESPLTPGEIAEIVGLSSRQLERLFRKHLHTTPKSHYTSLRLRKARDLIFQTNMKLSEISFACGFSSQTHFSKCYRAFFGISPSRDDGRFEAASANRGSFTIA
ncbi:GlxA family transcriptional regulator [Shimia abyssi]|uniref:AraC family transcriptional regulator with amidase-like domain n=1 Tax=Shimia abyssi TaxID=1662395 RepID=A0A2P8F4F0_9RHOB|nr:GlxA family transcriptional regulator [Shimia abyssi]PSL16588.1 AraC family transcriptional regulator with amidase-like domain [Shimia abyssi]